MKIPPEFYGLLKDRINLSDIVRTKVPLTKKSGVYVGLCPFHMEKTPSFTVNDAKQFYYCFGCAASGDVIKFVSSTTGLSNNEAAIKLAQDYGIELPKLTREQEDFYQEHDQIVGVLELAAQFFKSQLNGEIRDYLQRRNINQELTSKFDLGFAPSGGQLQKFFDAKAVPLMMLVKAGLAGKNEDGRIYEVFRGRIMFPIRNVYNKIIGFGGRVIDGAMPKYLNSPETVIFKKSEALYAEQFAISASHKSKYAILVEGYMDAIALHSAGFPETVASLGTAVTEDHLRKLWRAGDEVIICLDGDSAGNRAAMRVINLVLPLIASDKKVSFVCLPDNCDPDDIIRKNGADFFRQLIDKRLSLSEMIWHSEYDGKIFASAETKAALETTLENYARRISDRSLSINYRRFFKDQFWQKLVKHQGKIFKEKQQMISLAAQHGYSETEHLEYALCSMLVKFPELLKQEDIRDFMDNINFHNHDLSDFCHWLFAATAGAEPDQEIIMEDVKKKVEDTGFCEVFLLLSRPDNMFLDTSFQSTTKINHISLWEFLRKQYYFISLKHEYIAMIQQGTDNDPDRITLYQQEILKISQELQEMDNAIFYLRQV